MTPRSPSCDQRHDPPRRRTSYVEASGVLLAVTALIWTAWYGMQPVYSPCVYYGDHSHEKAVEYGQCDPPKTRLSTWTQ
ncbi:hypothetical protein GCM10010275_71500 [Streptomyces litmocidini]|nr:hypothetical protein GCM10010275_71500 [Streptomyces litmocidini]